MAGFLESIGSGLRQGGLALAGGMSNEVFREQGQAIAQRKQDEQRRRAQVAETMLRAVHSGQVAPDKIPLVRDAMARLGYDIPIDVLGPTPEAREKLDQYARDKENRRLQADSERDIENLWKPREGLGTRGGLDAATPPLIPRTNVQTFPLAPPDRQMGTPVAPQMPQDQQDQVGDIEALSDNPDYPPEMIPPGDSTTMQDGEIGQLAPVEVVGRRPAPVTPSQPTPAPTLTQDAVPGPMGGMVPRQLADKWEIIVRAKNRGVPVAGDLFKQLLAQMYPGKGDFVTVGEGQTLVDPITGKAVFQGQPKSAASSGLGKLIAERNALATANPSDPLLAKYDEAINNFKTGITIENYGSPTQGIGPDGKPVFFQPSNKGGAPNIVEGVTPAPKEKPEKVLPTKAIENISGAANAAEDTERFSSTFKPEYGGHFILGRLSNTIGRTLGDASGQAQWWQDLDAHQNITRHALFGSALTKTELASWERTAVNPTMNPVEITKNLERRMAIERRAAAKLAKSYIAQGYSVDGVRELLGPSADYLLESPTPTVTDGASKPAAKKIMTIKSGKDAGEYYQENGKWYKK